MTKSILRKISAITLAVFLIISGGDAHTQETSNITAKATVLTRISVTSKRDLDFGENIVPGIQNIVDKTSASSGKFSISGQASKYISISFLLPSQLINGQNSMPITFTSTDAGYQLPHGSVIAINPAGASTVKFDKEGTMDIFLGGKVTPSGSQATGLYSSAITVNLQYTGL